MCSKKEISRTLEKLQKQSSGKHFLVGFDGFIDEIIHVVAERIDMGEYVRLKTIKEFSDRIAGSAGLSTNIEIVPQKSKLGGNGPIMAQALMALKKEVSYIGALGHPFTHTVFEDFAKNCKNVISLTDPGYTQALEFLDGKIMLGKMNRLNEVTWENILKSCPEQQLTKILEDVSVIAYTNWTMLPNMNGIVRGIENITRQNNYAPYSFFDLADPQKRTKKDISAFLNILKSRQGKTILSMNEKESAIIESTLDLPQEKDLLQRARHIRLSLDIEAVVIHPVDRAVVSHHSCEASVPGPYTSEPVLTTGAGDNFNAGFCNALADGLSFSESLCAGNFTSGFYVRHAHSPSLEELTRFMSTFI